MKCPVCGQENKPSLCPKCGFDSSRDYEKYPTFGIVEKAPAVSALRKDWAEKQRPVEPEIPPEEFLDRDFRDAFGDFESLFEPEVARKPPVKLVWITAVICVAALTLLIWGKVRMGEKMPAKPRETQPRQNASASSNWHSNYLLADVPESAYVYGTSILKNSVKTITFLDTLNDAPEDAIDVSVNPTMNADSPEIVKLWAIQNGDHFDLYFAADGGINAQFACNRMFLGYSALTEINFGGNFHTDHVQNMSLMFAGCFSLKNLDLSTFNTSNVEDMSSMFLSCVNLERLDLSSFDTSHVQLMTCMFQGCVNLNKVDLSTFDTSNVLTTNMFDQCPAGDDWQHLLH